MPEVFRLVHGNRQEPVAVAEFFVAEAGLLRTEEQSDASCAMRSRELFADPCGSFGQRVKRMLQGSFADCGCTYDQRAVSDCLCDAGKGGRRSHHLRGIHCGSCGLKWHWVFVYDAQMLETEVVHGSGYRSDIVWVAGTHENYGDSIGLFWTEHHV
jgi:hypothetical protein